jgi:hypothetical protein
VSNGTNGWYYFNGSVSELRSTAENNVIYIDHTNASKNTASCGSEPRLWAFAEDGPNDYIDAFTIATQCFYGGILGNQPATSASFSGFTFSIR